jgi:hypothetical protein
MVYKRSACRPSAHLFFSVQQRFLEVRETFSADSVSHLVTIC